MQIGAAEMYVLLAADRQEIQTLFYSTTNFLYLNITDAVCSHTNSLNQ
jgi:hypothetical protein